MKPKETSPTRSQCITLTDRRTMTVTGVNDTDSFSENKVMLYTDLGELTVKGHDLHISSLSVETGEMCIEGTIDAVIYGDSQVKGPLSLFGKLTK